MTTLHHWLNACTVFQLLLPWKMHLTMFKSPALLQFLLRKSPMQGVDLQVDQWAGTRDSLILTLRLCLAKKFAFEKLTYPPPKKRKNFFTFTQKHQPNSRFAPSLSNLKDMTSKKVFDFKMRKRIVCRFHNLVL